MKLSLIGTIVGLAATANAKTVTCCDRDGGNCTTVIEGTSTSPMTMHNALGTKKIVKLSQSERSTFFGRTAILYDHISQDGFTFRLEVIHGKMPTAQVLTPAGQVYAQLPECRVFDY
ncbi:MAG: hypothetical protein KF789_12560 [Bdellovibrionaceae bacterium]|nr:hypothetical protein [Pseudobdellovibrionaceae bacterium]